MDIIALIEWRELSQTYFAQYFVSGGPIVWFVLLPMSIMAVYFMAEMSILVRRRKLLPANIGSDIITVGARSGFDSIPGRFGKKNDFVSRAICAVHEKTRTMAASPALMSQIAAESLQEQGMKLLRKNEWCNLLGAVAPMVGLFGTVCGMISAFNQLGISAGQPRPAQLASAISVALVTTFWGLLIAIPCLFVHGVFRTRIENLIAEAAVEVETLLVRLGQMQCPVQSSSPAANEKAGKLSVLTDAANDKMPMQKIVETAAGRPANPQLDRTSDSNRLNNSIKR